MINAQQENTEKQEEKLNALLKEPNLLDFQNKKSENPIKYRMQTTSFKRTGGLKRYMLFTLSSQRLCLR